MKKIMFLMATLVLSVFVFVACEDHEHASGETQPETEMVGIPDSIREKIKQQDTVLTTCSEKIDGLVNMQNETNKNISDLQNQVNNLKEPSSIWHIFIIVSLLFSITALFLWAILNKKLFDEKSIKNIISKSEDIKTIKCKIREMKDSLSVRPKNSSKDVSAGFYEIKLRLDELQRQINELKKSNIVTGEPTGGGKPIGNPTRFVYVNAVNDLFFVQTTPNLQDNSIFKINFTSQTLGNFNIINIKKIQQNNQLKNVVEVVHSSCQLAEAKDCKVVEEGKCELKDGYWKVTKKIQIKIW